MKNLAFFIVCSIFVPFVLVAGAVGGDKMEYNDSYNVYKLKPYNNDILEHYIQIPKTWKPEKVVAKNKDITPAPKTIDVFSHQGEEDGALSQVQVLAASFGGKNTPLAWIQYYLHQVSKANKIYIHAITTIDEYRAKASLDWTIQGNLFHGEVFINITNDRSRIFIVQGVSNEKSKEAWTEQCDFIFRSFSVIN